MLELTKNGRWRMSVDLKQRSNKRPEKNPLFQQK